MSLIYQCLQSLSIGKIKKISALSLTTNPLLLFNYLCLYGINCEQKFIFSRQEKNMKLSLENTKNEYSLEARVNVFVSFIDEVGLWQRKCAKEPSMKYIGF